MLELTNGVYLDSKGCSLARNNEVRKDILSGILHCGENGGDDKKCYIMQILSIFRLASLRMWWIDVYFIGGSPVFIYGLYEAFQN